MYTLLGGIDQPDIRNFRPTFKVRSDKSRWRPFLRLPKC